MQIDIERLIHSTKTAIACVFGLFLAKAVGLSADQWVVVTIIVVMCAQIYVGSVLSRALLRLLGTLVGCLFAVITLLTLGHSNASTLLVIALSSFLFSYVATGKENLTYTGTLGAVTTTIIMLSANPTALTAIERFLEIAIGIVIAALVSQFILPIHGRDHLRRAQATTLEELRDFYIATMIAQSIETPEAYQDRDESIVKLLLKQRALAKEPVREIFGTPFDKDHFMQTLYCERNMLRTISLMQFALRQMDKDKITLTNIATLHTFNEAILQSLNVIIKTIQSKTAIQDRFQLPPLALLKQDFVASIETTPREKLIYIDGLLLAAEMLTESITKLAELYQIEVK